MFVCGWCFSPEAEIRSLSFLLDGEPQPVASHGKKERPGTGLEKKAMTFKIDNMISFGYNS